MLLTLKSNRIHFGLRLLLLHLLLLQGMTSQAQAQPGSRSSGSPEHSSQIMFRPPGNGAPDNTVGGGTREGGVCSQSVTEPNPGFMPVLPKTGHGLTAADRPTFFAYVPSTVAQTVFFSIQGEDSDYYYQKTFALGGASSIISVTLPADAPPLEVGKQYRWSFVLQCNAQLRPDDPMVEGRVQRIALTPAITSQVSRASARQRASLYGEAGLWFDLLASLVTLRQAAPQDAGLNEVWQTILSENGMEAIATAPLSHR